MILFYKWCGKFNNSLEHRFSIALLCFELIQRRHTNKKSLFDLDNKTMGLVIVVQKNMLCKNKYKKYGGGIFCIPEI